MRYSIDDVVSLQFAAEKMKVSAVLLQGVIISLGENNAGSFVSQCEKEIKEAMKVINEIGPR